MFGPIKTSLYGISNVSGNSNVTFSYVYLKVIGQVDFIWLTGVRFKIIVSYYEVIPEVIVNYI